MPNHAFIRRSRLPASAAEVFAWHERHGAFERLTPTWERVQVVRQAGGIHNGGRATLRTMVGPVGVAWELEHVDFQQDRQFRDVQLRGPFKSWVHTHTVTPESADACTLEDRIEYT